MREYESQLFLHPQDIVAALTLEEGMHVADLGAGSGMHTHHIAERVGTSGKVYAVDIQRELLRRIHTEAQKKALHAVEIVWADLTSGNATRIPSSSLDRVLLANLLFQTADKHLVLEEARRILKPSGRLLVVEWTHDREAFGPERHRRLSPEVLRRTLEDSGFEHLHGGHMGSHHHAHLFRAASVIR
jgi:ubiquinone/menaquinone biosynthesis C-methylase UbiE